VNDTIVAGDKVLHESNIWKVDRVIERQGIWLVELYLPMDPNIRKRTYLYAVEKLGDA
jgi:hypothetical protein